MQSQTTTRHCAYEWCCITSHPGHDDHFADEYVTVSRSGPYRPSLRVGAGVLVTDGADSRPAIYVHIHTPDDKVDEDAYMTVNEAVDLVDALISAIAHARSVDV